MDTNKHIVYTKQVIKDIRHVFTLFLAFNEAGRQAKSIWNHVLLLEQTVMPPAFPPAGWL
jgi:hypothetical protein